MLKLWVERYDKSAIMRALYKGVFCECGKPAIIKFKCMTCYNKAYNLLKPYAMYSETHKEKRRLAKRLWAKRHKEQDLAIHKAWRANNIERERINKRAQEKSWTSDEWLALKRQYGNHCVGCWKHESELKEMGRMLVPDHIVPLAKGGLNHITNLQPLCHTGKGGVPGACNGVKKDKYIDFLIT